MLVNNFSVNVVSSSNVGIEELSTGAGRQRHCLCRQSARIKVTARGVAPLDLHNDTKRKDKCEGVGRKSMG